MRSAIVKDLSDKLNSIAKKPIEFSDQPIKKLEEWIKKNNSEEVNIQQRESCLKLAEQAFHKIDNKELMLRYDDCISYLLSKCEIIKTRKTTDLIDFFTTNKPNDIIFWHGLVSTYFLFNDECELGKENWLKIQRLLRENIGYIVRISEGYYDWVNYLSEHQDLLTNQPGVRLAEASIKQKKDTTTELNNKIKIPPNSWFWKQYLLTKISVAEKSDEFVTILDDFIHDLDKDQFLSVRDDGIKQLIEIYYKKNIISKHTELLDFAIKYWNAPYRDTKESFHWRLLSDDAYQMMLDWYTSDLLEEIFDRGLKPYENGKTADNMKLLDVNRLRFWSNYIKAIGGRCFMLYGSYFNEENRLLYRVMKKYSQHIGMQVGDDYNFSFVIEFSSLYAVVSTHKGNALYFYTKGHHPKELDECRPTKYKKDKDIKKPVFNINDLKNRPLAEATGKRIVQDVNGNWMGLAAQFLKDNGIYPDEHIISSKIEPNYQQPTPRPTQAPSKPIISQSETKVQDAFIPAKIYVSDLDWVKKAKELANKYKVNTTDHLSAGGNFWILVTEQYPNFNVIKFELLRLGFQMKLDKGFWRKN